MALISETTTGELAPAPPQVRKLLLDLPKEGLLELSSSDEVEQLTQAYLSAGVVSERFRVGAAHIADATVYVADVVASGTYRHTLNLARTQPLRDLNLWRGFR